MVTESGQRRVQAREHACLTLGWMCSVLAEDPRGTSFPSCFHEVRLRHHQAPAPGFVGRKVWMGLQRAVISESPCFPSQDCLREDAGSPGWGSKACFSLITFIKP